MTEARVFRAEEINWYEPPGHFRGYSKLLVGPDSPLARCQELDFRISLYPPEGYVEEHVHQESENIYYIIRGHGALDLDGQRHVVGPNTVAYIPPGVRHSIRNTGNEDLLFIVIATKPGDMPR